MTQYEFFTSKFPAWLNYRPTLARWLWAGVALVAFVVIGSTTSPLAVGEVAKHGRVSGAGRTIIEGGTGGTSPERAKGKRTPMLWPRLNSEASESVRGTM